MKHLHAGAAHSAKVKGPVSRGHRVLGLSCDWKHRSSSASLFNGRQLSLRVSGDGEDAQCPLAPPLVGALKGIIGVLTLEEKPS